MVGRKLTEYFELIKPLVDFKYEVSDDDDYNVDLDDDVDYG